jgi:NADH-quinone oxidoreductase subunit J
MKVPQGRLDPKRISSLDFEFLISVVEFGRGRTPPWSNMDLKPYIDLLVKMLPYAAYAVYLVLILAGCLLAVRCRSLVRSLLGLILTLFGVAGMYFLMAAPFMALMQILIYVGAVSVLIFFAIMLTRNPEGEAGEEGGNTKGWLRVVLSVVSGFLPAALLAAAVLTKSPKAFPLKPELSLAKLGQFLSGPYLLAFELISVALLAAMVGAIVIGFERRKSA